MLADSNCHQFATIIKAIDSRLALPEDPAMAKRTKKRTVFLIADENRLRNKMANSLRDVGYDVHEYMTAREFLIDKRHHLRGVVVCNYRLLGMTGMELCQQLAEERVDFPTVLIVGRVDVSNVLAGNVTHLIVKPFTIKSVQEAIAGATESDNFTDAELELAFRKVTGREREICELVVAGKSSREIAAEQGLSKSTVEAHRVRIMAKTRADDVGHLSRMWRAWKEMNKIE